MFIRPLTLSASIILLSQTLLGQGGDVRGVVTDSTTGERVPFASIIIGGASKGGATNINGFFLVTNIPPGVYEISASSIGYIKKSRRLVVRSEETSVADFQLAPQAVEFSEVIVTDKAKRELSEINTSIHVMEPSDVKAVPVTLQEDVFRAIQILPGIVSTSDVNTHFYVRGGGGDQNLILLDGMKIYNPYHAFGIFSIFDSDIMKTTEVYTGSFPPGYGGRLSSVVSLITRDGKTKDISANANVNFISSKVEVEGPISSDTHFLASGRKSFFSGSLNKFLQKDLPLSFYDGFVKLVHEGEESHSRYGFEGFYTGDDLRSPNKQEANYSWRNHAVGLTGGGLIQDRIFVDAVAYENFFEATRDPQQSTTISPARTSVQELGLRVNATLYTNSKNLFFFGFEFSFPTLEYDLVNNFGVSRRLYSTVIETWTWIRYQATVGNFQFDGGFHFDAASLFLRSAGLEVVQPRINVSYQLDEYWKAKLSYGRFNQNVITINNEDDVVSIFDAWVAIPDNLKSERADHYVIGIEGSPASRLSTSFEMYYKYYGSLVSYNRDKVDATDADYINSTGNSYGAEILSRYAITSVDVYAAYTFGHSTIDNGGITYPPRYDRRHTLNLLSVFHVYDDFDCTLRWELGSGFPFTETDGFYDRLNLTNFYKTPFVGTTGTTYTELGDKNAARLPAYHRLDMSLTYRFAIERLHGSLGVHIINVYDHTNIFYFDRTTGQQVNMLSFFPSLTLSLQY